MASEPPIPLELKFQKDLTDCFRSPKLKDAFLSPAKGDLRSSGLERSGSIHIDPVVTNNGEQFRIQLLDRLFRPADRPLRRSNSAIINLNQGSLFATVQKCRERWQEALDTAKYVVRTATGTDRTRYKFEDNWNKPVDDDAFKIIASKMAVTGSRMFQAVFESNAGTALDEIARTLREAMGSGEHSVTINAPDFHIPWRMLYTHPDADGGLAKDGSNFLPNGFWGYQHIIEEFTNDYGILDHVTATNGKLGFGAALHEAIDQEFGVACISCHRNFVHKHGGRLAYVEWTKKSEVIRGLEQDPFSQQVVYFLCHGEGAGSADKSNLKPPFLKLADGTIDPTDVREAIGSRRRFDGRAPLVFVNACRGAQFETVITQNFSFATEFLEQGAVCFIGPQIEVPAVFAGEFGKQFFDAFLVANDVVPPFAGVILRDLTRQMWEQNNPFGLVYSLYAGADCHIDWDRGAQT
jgi:hypothetical protein